MSFIKTKGFVIQSIVYRDSNRLLKLLTPEYGLLTCSVQGAKSKKSTLRVASIIASVIECNLQALLMHIYL